MSNKWVLIHLADQFGLQIHENKAFGQLNTTNQLLTIDSAITTPIFSISFRLSPNLNHGSLKASINQFNKLKLGKALIEDSQLQIHEIKGTLFSPEKVLERIKRTVNWWDEELSKFQNFDKFRAVALFKYGPDIDDSARLIEKASSDSLDRKPLSHIAFKSFLLCSFFGMASAYLRKFNFSMDLLDMFFVVGIIGKSFKLEGKSFGTRTSILIVLFFLGFFSFEQIVKHVSCLYLWEGCSGGMEYLTIKNSLVLIYPLLFSSFILASVYWREKSPAIVRGKYVDKKDLEFAEISYKKMRINIFSFSSIFLMVVSLIVSMASILHDVVYFDLTTFIILFIAFIFSVFCLNMFFSKKYLGYSPLVRHEREGRFELFEENFCRCLTSCFFSLSLVLLVATCNVLGDPFERSEELAKLKADLPGKVKHCISLPVLIKGSFLEELSFCDVDQSLKSESEIQVWIGKGLFGIPYVYKPRNSN